MIALAVPLILLSTLAQTRAPAPHDLVARAVTAMGGESALRGLRGSAIDRSHSRPYAELVIREADGSRFPGCLSNIGYQGSSAASGRLRWP